MRGGKGSGSNSAGELREQTPERERGVNRGKEEKLERNRERESPVNRGKGKTVSDEEEKRKASSRGSRRGRKL